MPGRHHQVEYTLTVTDTALGTFREYSNPLVNAPVLLFLNLGDSRQ